MADNERTIGEIREAFRRMHAYATGRSGEPYMHIPADPNRDADIILEDAIDELAATRERLRAAEVVVEIARREHDGCHRRLCAMMEALAAYDKIRKGE